MNYKVITPVTTEPVTLAEAKLHLRVTSDSFAGDVKTTQSITPGSHAIAADYSLAGAAVNVRGFAAIVTLNAGACGAGGSVTAKIQESDDNANWQDVAGGAFSTVTEATDNAVQELSYAGVKQYIRVVATVAGAACAFSADVVTKTGDATEDALIKGLITAAREYCEGVTRRALASQTIEAYLNCFPRENRIELPRPPLQSVTSVKYKNSAGSEKTLAENTDYLVDAESNVGGLVLPYGKSWPSFTAYPVNPIKIRFIAGYFSENPIPKSIKQAMLLLIGHWYEHREAVISATVSKEIEFAVKALLALWKAGWF